MAHASDDQLFFLVPGAATLQGDEDVLTDCLLVRSIAEESLRVTAQAQAKEQRTKITPAASTAAALPAWDTYPRTSEVSIKVGMSNYQQRLEAVMPQNGESKVFILAMHPTEHDSINSQVPSLNPNPERQPQRSASSDVTFATGEVPHVWIALHLRTHQPGEP